MSRPLSEFVWHESFQADGEDEHGNPVDAWGPMTAVYIYAFDPGGSVEPRIPGHDRVVTEPTLYVPSDVYFGARDRVRARGLLFEVEGETAVWSHPNGLAPGNVVRLRKVEG